MSWFDVGLINGLLDSGTLEKNFVPDYEDNYEKKEILEKKNSQENAEEHNLKVESPPEDIDKNNNNISTENKSDNIITQNDNFVKNKKKSFLHRKLKNNKFKA